MVEVEAEDAQRRDAPERGRNGSRELVFLHVQGLQVDEVAEISRQFARKIAAVEVQGPYVDELRDGRRKRPAEVRVVMEIEVLEVRELADRIGQGADEVVVDEVEVEYRRRVIDIVIILVVILFRRRGV